MPFTCLAGPHGGSFPVRSLAVLALAGVVAGCATRTEPLRPTVSAIAVPADWSVASLAPSDARTNTSAPIRHSVDSTDASAGPAWAPWWRQFNDPWLVDLVQQSLQAHTSVRLAQAALQQSRAQRDVTLAGDSVRVGGSASAQRSQVGDGAAGNTFRAGFDASWEPDVFDARRQTQLASEADVRAAQAAVAQARVSLAAEVAAAVIELRGLGLRSRLAQDNLARQIETLDLTRWRVQAGLASSVDLEQARTTVEQTRATLPTLQAGVRQSLNALAVLTGQTPGALSQAWATQASEPIAQPPTGMALRFPAETLRQRPDVRAAEERVSAAWSRVQVADAQRYPSFALSGSLGLSAGRLGDVLDLSALTRSVLASVTASLLDGGAQRAQVRAQEAALEQARINHEAAVLTALQDVENALAALQGSRERLERLQAAAQAASDAEWLARQRYASGLIDYRTVLDTQRTLLSSQIELALGQAAVGTDHVRLYKALGGGWAPETDRTPATP